MEDSLAEDRHSPVPGLVHRYPDRVLMLVTTQCASYCRYCTRSRIVGDPTQNFNRKDHEAQLEYLRRTPQVRDVLISGGDGLTLAPKLFESILRGLREIPHIEIVRIGSRVPVFLPQRIDDELCEMLEKYHPLWINLHFNHANEITPEVSRAVDRLTKAGLPVGNQSVLLAGVNDCVNIQRDLVHKLVENRIRPYYLYQCDLVEGSGHFRTPVGKGLEIIEGLRGHTSGYAVPTYVIDAPGGGGKIPVMPNYLISYSDHKVVLRNYEGYITTYEEPLEYKPHDKASCASCQHTRPEPGQSGVHGLLQGEQMWIEPRGFEDVHTRGNTEQHRLQDPSKWVPFGVGAIEGQAQPPLRVLQSGEAAPEEAAPGSHPSTGRARSRGRARASRRPRRTGNCSRRRAADAPFDSTERFPRAASVWRPAVRSCRTSHRQAAVCSDCRMNGFERCLRSTQHPNSFDVVEQAGSWRTLRRWRSAASARAARRRSAGFSRGSTARCSGRPRRRTSWSRKGDRLPSIPAGDGGTLIVELPDDDAQPPATEPQSAD